jgi:hypothetical protein
MCPISRQRRIEYVHTIGRIPIVRTQFEVSANIPNYIREKLKGFNPIRANEAAIDLRLIEHHRSGHIDGWRR